MKRNNSVYSPLVTLWLMVEQRLQGGVSLEAAVLQLLGGLPDSFWPHPCKRIRDWREHGKTPSSHTGAYNQARLALPLSVVEKSCDRIFDQLMTEIGEPVSEGSRRVFLLDGTSMRASHTPGLCNAYPPGSNHLGESHWPLLRVLVAHDLDTGLAMRPEWGPMRGDHAVSEQALLKRAIGRLPSGSTVMGDANFGVFSVAYAATVCERPMLLRLTAARARPLAGGTLVDGIDREVEWKPSREERKKHRDLPPNASVKGRLVVQRVQPDSGKPFLLPFFTTLPSSMEEVLKLYGQRWTIETDLRTLKSTLRLDQYTSLTPDMVAKEIDLGMAAYNLIRAVISLAAKQSGVPPRGYSFTKVRLILQVFAPALAAAPTPQAAKQIVGQIMRYVQQSKLPKRKRKRPSYPRETWKRGQTYPSRKK